MTRVNMHRELTHLLNFMELSKSFERISTEYAAAKSEPFAQHPLANFIRQSVPEKVRTLLGADAKPYVIRGSAGQGRWGDSPWVAILDPIVTESPEYGYYPVFLFGPGFQGFSLVLGQGTYSVRKEFKKKGPDILSSRSDILRNRVPEFSQRFSRGPFQVIGSKHAAGDWSTGSAWGKNYSFSQPPSDEEVRYDLLEMVRLYRLAVMRGGYDISGVGGEENEQEEETPADMQEGERRLKIHQRIERRRNGKLAIAAKKIHGYSCQGCGFDFSAVYGEIGKSYIDAHHLIPLASLSEEGPLMLNPKEDFAVLCANCHRMIHKLGCPKLEDFKLHINSGLIAALHQVNAKS